MNAKEMNPQVDVYLNRAVKWREEMKELRKLLLGCLLTEELKWGKPCYSFKGKNIAIIQGFKQYCALLFFKGALLKDPDHILVKTGVNTQVGRQIRFTTPAEIINISSILKAYIDEAVEVEKSGLKVIVEQQPKPIPEELKKKFDDDLSFKTAFEALTPGRQRAYIFHFSAPKQSKTKEIRIEKCMPKILAGKGLMD